MQQSKLYLYIFVRHNIPVANQIIQVAHAVSDWASWNSFTEQPTIVLIGVPTEFDLGIISQRFGNEEQYAFHEPDYPNGVSALVFPTLEEYRSTFAEFETYKSFNNTAEERKEV
jgi:hypothetical protein